MQGHTKLPDYHEIGGFPKNPWWNMISSIGREGMELAKDLLRFDPVARLAARAVSITARTPHVVDTTHAPS